jgi:predicted Fe-Mo cluster-binding NifX family protein
MKKIAISSTGKDINSNVDNVFGRCQYFIIAEIKDKKVVNVKTLKNLSANKVGSAGVSAAQIIAENDANVVISGNFGPKAFSVLEQFDIKMYKGSGTVKDVLHQFMNGSLKMAEK